MQEGDDTGGAATRSFSKLLRTLAHDSGALLRQEIELARIELAHGLRRTATGAGWLAAGAAIVVIGLVVLIAALVLGLGDLLDNYLLSASLVGLLFVLIGGVLAATTVTLLRRRVPPGPAREQLREDRRWARTEIQQVTHDLTRPSERVANKE